MWCYWRNRGVFSPGFGCTSSFYGYSAILVHWKQEYIILSQICLKNTLQYEIYFCVWLILLQSIHHLLVAKFTTPYWNIYNHHPNNLSSASFARAEKFSQKHFHYKLITYLVICDFFLKSTDFFCQRIILWITFS